MNNVLFALVVSVLLLVAMVIGERRQAYVPASREPVAEQRAPHIGSVQVLNGCGRTRAARAVANYLRDKGSFDVKNTRQAPTSNYPFTMVVARTADMKNAQQIAKILRTDKLLLMRNDESLYEVDVIVGPDYQERIQ